MKVKQSDVKTWFEEWHIEYMRKHPVWHWIDTSLFKEKTIFTYAPHYILFHPWELIEEAARQVKWAWQRVFRGWDDTVIWGIDYYLAENLPVWLQRLKEIKHGIPVSYFPKDEDFLPGNEEQYAKNEAIAEAAWNKDIDKIIAGFLAWKEIEDASFEWNNIKDLDKQENIRHKKFKEGMKIFVDNYGSFWD